MIDIEKALHDLLLTQFGTVVPNEKVEKFVRSIEPELKKPSYNMEVVTDYYDLQECEQQLETRREIREQIKTDLFKWFQDEEIKKFEKDIESTQIMLEELE